METHNFHYYSFLIWPLGVITSFKVCGKYALPGDGGPIEYKGLKFPLSILIHSWKNDHFATSSQKFTSQFHTIVNSCIGRLPAQARTFECIVAELYVIRCSVCSQFQTCEYVNPQLYEIVTWIEFTVELGLSSESKEVFPEELHRALDWSSRQVVRHSQWL